MSGLRRQTVGFFLEHSKVSPDGVGGEFDIYIEDGPGVKWGDIDDFGALVNRATKSGIIESVPNGWLYEGTKYTTKKELVASLQENRLALTKFRDTVSRSILVYRKEAKVEEDADN